ncbi:hypothetical protein HZ326_2474 [Fusarium oxysporum f. sp. albedinis]|jgi:hypothetical protein|nr:hypothetical protein HZ326_2474 [Fusarium oxysporum f. sp. albedinis]
MYMIKKTDFMRTNSSRIYPDYKCRKQKKFLSLSSHCNHCPDIDLSSLVDNYTMLTSGQKETWENFSQVH